MFVPPSGVERKKYCSRRCAGLGRPLNGKPSKIATAAVAAFIERTPVLAVPEFRVGHWSIDLAFPLQMVALELDGCYWHSLPAMVEKDRRKDEALRAAGWSVVRVVIETRDDVENVVQRMNQVMREWIPRRRR